jgi:hypothetical protein
VNQVLLRTLMITVDSNDYKNSLVQLQTQMPRQQLSCSNSPTQMIYWTLLDGQYYKQDLPIVVLIKTRIKEHIPGIQILLIYNTLLINLLIFWIPMLSPWKTPKIPNFRNVFLKTMKNLTKVNMIQKIMANLLEIWLIHLLTHNNGSLIQFNQ